MALLRRRRRRRARLASTRQDCGDGCEQQQTARSRKLTQWQVTRLRSTTTTTML
jgi:hypothetical protein